MRYTPLLALLALRSYAQTTTSLDISEDGNCGLSFSQTCLGSRFGDCCSGKGFCGSTTDYCGADCQDEFGTCTSANSTLISSNGDCGASDSEGQICLGSTFGNCCSEKGFCGSTSDYCGTGCQSEYGNCGSNEGAESTATPSSTANTSTGTESPPTSTTSSALPEGTTTTPSQNDTQAASDVGAENTSDDSLSSGAVAGVAIGAVGGAAILAGALFFVLRRRRQRTQSAELGAGEPLPPKSAVSVSAMTSDSGSISPYGYPPMPLPKGQMKVSEMSEKGEERAELSAVPGTHSRSAGAPTELPTERYS